ncbi:histidine phosphatase family protein [Caldimonas sp.]|uniref:histidine phosphatase family protein n=1 Tax=Caldimonas sp. TaxID=2838790 RepID=UPI00391B988E
MSHPQPTRILAIRHGETAWNVDTRIQGHLDIPLNDTGRRQARRLARALADENLQAVYSSDLSRARQTAQALAELTGLPVQPVPGLRERAFGRFEGRTFREIEAQWPQQALRWRQRDPEFCPEGGESLNVFYRRVVEQAGALACAHPGQTIALVAHGGVLDCLYRAATRIDLRAPRTWELANASINRLLYTPEGFTLVGWADTQHLQDLALDEILERPGR